MACQGQSTECVTSNSAFRFYLNAYIHTTWCVAANANMAVTKSDKKRVSSKNTVEDMTMSPNERILKNITELYDTGLNTGGEIVLPVPSRKILHEW